MRALLLVLAISVASVGSVHAERFKMELEWGFGPNPSEIYWDGEFQVTGGRLISLEPISFERDRHDRLVLPRRLQSYTLNSGTDGMQLVVEGDDETQLQLESKEGMFRWRLERLRKSGDQLLLAFAGRKNGQHAVGILIVAAAQDDGLGTVGALAVGHG